MTRLDLIVQLGVWKKGYEDIQNQMFSHLDGQGGAASFTAVDSDVLSVYDQQASGAQSNKRPKFLGKQHGIGSGAGIM